MMRIATTLRLAVTVGLALLIGSLPAGIAISQEQEPPPLTHQTWLPVIKLGGGNPMARQGIIFDACFNQQGNDGKLYGFFWHQNPPQVVASGSHGVSSREGTHMMECYLNRETSQYSYRTMGLFSEDDESEPDAGPSFAYSFGTDYWIGMSVYLEDWVSDPLADIVWQTQARPDYGEIYRQPCLYIGTQDNEWKIRSRWDTRSFSPPSDGTHWPHSAWLYQADLTPDINAWTDWVFHIIWSWTDSGLVQVWKNGVLVAERSGGNCSNDVVGPYSSAGIYEFTWDDPGHVYVANWRRLWFDSVRIGDSTSSYSDVAPGGEAESTTSTTTVSTTSTTTVSTTSTITVSTTSTTLSPYGNKLIVDCDDGKQTIESLSSEEIADRDATAAEVAGRGF